LKTAPGLTLSGNTIGYAKGLLREKPHVGEKTNGGLESRFVDLYFGISKTDGPETLLRGEIVKNP